MSRLYYEDKTQKVPPSTEILRNENIENTPSQESGSGGGTNYLEKVSKLIPSEVIAGYLAMFGFAKTVSTSDDGIVTIGWIFYAIFFFCLLLTPLYLYFQSKKGKPKVIHIVVSTIAFCVWAYTTTGDDFFEGFEAGHASIALIAFSLVSAIIPLRK